MKIQIFEKQFENKWKRVFLLINLNMKINYGKSCEYIYEIKEFTISKKCDKQNLTKKHLEIKENSH